MTFFQKDNRREFGQNSIRYPTPSYLSLCLSPSLSFWFSVSVSLSLSLALSVSLSRLCLSLVSVSLTSFVMYPVGVRLLRCDLAGGGCEKCAGHPLSAYRESYSQECLAQTSRDRHQQMRPGPRMGHQEMGQDLVSRVPHSRLPRLHYQCIWQGCPH
jgi:hypothetical protein